MEPTKLIKQFHQEYTKLITDFSIIDEQDPLSQETAKKLLDLLKHWEKIISEGFNKHTIFIENYQERISKAKLKYNSTISSLNGGLNRALKNITNAHVEACKNLKQKIETSKENNQYAIEQLELDYNYFVSTSEQNLELLQNDFEDAKKRYDYQKDEAKDSYFEIVKKNNELLDNIRIELLENHNSSLASFQKEQEELLEQLELIVLEKSDELDNLLRALENEKNNMKEKYRQESASLNENIKKYSSEKNQIIDNARNQYNKAINDASIEKENKKQIYQNNLQALLKEFVTKITEIEEQASQIRKDFEQLTDDMKRTYYTDVYNKTKVFHQQLENIYAASSNKQLDKYTQHLIQYKNKQHLIDMELSKKETELKLLTKTQK
ncbi:MAG: hypothetical protein K2I77_02105, partial [Anaeroplasmataceae bacterium]|nr:hypothetical protein [Anaeroplasmataceae bacterium]